MPCSRKAFCTKLLFNIITVLKLFLLFFYLFSLFFVNLFTYFLRNEDDSDDVLWSDEDEDEVEEEEEEVGYSHVNDKHLVADIVNNGQGLMFMSEYKHADTELNNHPTHHEHNRSSSSSSGSSFEDAVENFDSEIFYVEDDWSSSSEDSEIEKCPEFDDYEVLQQVYPTSSSLSYPPDEIIQPSNKVNINKDNNDHSVCQTNDEDVAKIYPKIATELKEHGRGQQLNSGKPEDVKVTNLSRDEKFLIFDLPKSEGKKLQVAEMEKFETFQDTNTVGSTSKSSSEWRSSIPTDSVCTEDPFSSSSRRSCPKWESYAVYQKYDQEMIFLDKITAQKLHQTETMRSIKVEPRSISQRIVHKLGKKQSSSSEEIYKKTNDELEAAYVGQICLAWEALNWNYTTFLRKRDPTCPAYVAQQFQQFQVLLQRYIENEPYERGRRPHIYARIRFSAPKLLHVPEYHDYEGGEDMEEALSSRVTSASFLSILEESIRTFMKFLKADRKTHCQVLTCLFKRRPKPSVDPAVLHVLKSHCNKKKMKLKEVERKSIVFGKKKIEREEEMEILMASIDIEVVSRVLRMTLLTKQQLKWCEEKMDKVRVFERKLQRDSSPLFFPGYPPTNTTLVIDSP